MALPGPGDVVTVDFPGAMGVKRRPAVVVSSRLYHEHRPDLVLGVVTTQVGSASTPTDYVLQDWQSAGPHRPSAFRAYFGMAERDRRGVRMCLEHAFGLEGAAGDPRS